MVTKTYFTFVVKHVVTGTTKVYWIEDAHAIIPFKTRCVNRSFYWEIQTNISFTFQYIYIYIYIYNSTFTSNRLKIM